MIYGHVFYAASDGTNVSEKHIVPAMDSSIQHVLLSVIIDIGSSKVGLS